MYTLKTIFQLFWNIASIYIIIYSYNNYFEMVHRNIPIPKYSIPIPRHEHNSKLWLLAPKPLSFCLGQRKLVKTVLIRFKNILNRDKSFRRQCIHIHSILLNSQPQKVSLRLWDRC
ncbi:hypothetical protein I3842_05G139300 [Carya illinoinensis]|uniref:Uncharacterized protein n=1 Tax=Carya illinoinensis TaxID=32201 RepID=A0A922EZB8_CARIL|nr:hypothetical protein I3842_05G139300 [Carya illinoinensis]